MFRPMIFFPSFLSTLVVSFRDGGPSPSPDNVADEVESSLRGKMIDRRLFFWEWQQVAPRVETDWNHGAAIGLRRFLDDAVKRQDWIIDADVLSELAPWQERGIDPQSLKALSDRVARPDLLPKHSSAPFRLTTDEWSPIRQHPFEAPLFEELKKKGLTFNERDSSVQLWGKGGQFVARLWLVFDNNRNLSDGAWVVEQFVSMPHGWSDPETLPTEFYEYPHFVWGTVAVQEADCLAPGSWIADKPPGDPDLELTCYQWTTKASKIHDTLTPQEPWLLGRRDKKGEVADLFRSTLVNLLGEPTPKRKTQAKRGGLLPRISPTTHPQGSVRVSFSRETFSPLPEISYQSGLGYPSGVFAVEPVTWRQFTQLPIDQQVKVMTKMPSKERDALLVLIADEEPERAALLRERFKPDGGF